ncbi:MAG TPA: hypothetical protein ENH37_09405 [Deltaproteobacteria bacterium]|nr:hypothetical protein [Deltaproteobacteria bacterium]
MPFSKKRSFSRNSRLRSGPFLQPLAVALVSLILVSLALIAGLMDLRTLDKTLVGYMEERGMEIIRNIQQAARYNYQVLDHASYSLHEGGAGPGITDEAFSLREAVVLALLDVAQQIDFERMGKDPDDQGLISTADRERLHLIALLDPEGTITFANRPVPAYILKAAGPVIRGEKEIWVDLFSGENTGDRLPSLALRRRWGKGTIILLLDEEGFSFWKLRLSFQRAVEEANPSPDTGYFVVTDGGGRVIFQWVEQPMGTGATPAIPPVSTESAGVSGRKFEWHGKKMLEVAAPVLVDPDIPCTARLSLSRATADQMLKKERGRGIIFMCFMALMAMVSMWVLYRNQNRHLARMREMERRLNRAERLSAMGRLAAGVAHEIRNPLNAISMACQRLKKENLLQLKGVIRDEIQRLNRIIEEFIAFSRVKGPVLKDKDVTDLLRQIVLLMDSEAGSRGIRLETSLNEYPLMASIDSDKMKQAILNIVKNAMESTPDRGTVTLSAARAGRRGVTITISDTGSGLSPREMDQIFNPYYTTKEKGLGLGLALAHEIVQAHSGEIRVISRHGKGTTFEIFLPVNPETHGGSQP